MKPAVPDGRKGMIWSNLPNKKLLKWKKIMIFLLKYQAFHISYWTEVYYAVVILKLKSIFF